MRYRRDVPSGTDLGEVARHIVEHLAGAVAPNDDPAHGRHEVRVEVRPHADDPDMLTVTGEIDGEPDAPYLHTDFDPATDHPEIKFTPYEEIDLGHYADYPALARFQEAQ